jgi:hypothetical protein
MGIMWIAVSLIYGLLWAALACLMNARGMSSARNAVFLGSAWLLMLVILPASIFAVADTVYPVRSRIESVRAKRDANARAMSMPEAELVDNHLARHPEFASREYSAEGKRRMLGYARWEAEESLLQESERVFEASLQAQQQLADIASLLSPAALTRSILLDLSGSGPHRYEHFLQQASRFRQKTRGFFWPLIYEDSEFRSADYSRVPQFRYEDESSLVIVRRAGPTVGLLLALTALIAMAAYWRSRRGIT